MNSRIFRIVAKNVLGVGNALAVIHSLSVGSYITAAINGAAMLYATTIKIPPQEK